ncbi:MAG: sialidase family protein [Candidatus Latescibacterota bacterium]|jgi:hypothetical protein
MTTPASLRPIAPGVFTERPKIVRLLDGSLLAFTSAPRQVVVRNSIDHGETWSAETPLLSLDSWLPGIGGVTEALVDQAGELHLFLLDQWRPDRRGEGERGGVGTYHGHRIDIWYVRSRRGRTEWSTPRCIWEGYTGALNSVIQTRSGRILLPFSYYTPRTWADRGTGLDAFTFTGSFDCVVLGSDDGGETWALSNPLRIPTPDITYAYGGCEPVVLELADGEIWMLIRGQTGRFWESRLASDGDGMTWSRPTPTRIISSDSPAGLVRLVDGRIVLLWNACLRHPYAYGGRQVLHAAISADEGATWRGMREVARDPLRHRPPPVSGDHGTAYPFPVVTADGAVLVCTGQGEGRTILARLEPEYLLETVQRTDFDGGLEDWSVFGTRGVGLVPHPDRDAARVLRLQRVDAEFPAAAVWNLPLGHTGQVRLRLRFEPGARGVWLGLADHFSTPFDEEDLFHAVFAVCFLPAADVADGVRIEPGLWHELVLAWRLAGSTCEVLLDGGIISHLPLLRRGEGICYLRLRTVATDPEEGGVLLESAEVNVSPSWGGTT